MNADATPERPADAGAPPSAPAPSQAATEAHSESVANLDAARLIRELRVEVRRWAEKAQEAGEAYGNANTKHHAELDRANRLERLANTLAERAVDLEDWARTAERALAEECAKVARVEALIDQWDGEIGAQEDYQHASAVRAVEACLRDLRAALVGPEAS